MALIISFCLFVIFAANVWMGSFASAAFLGDVGEMLVLAASCVAFVVGILKKEADAKK